METIRDLAWLAGLFEGEGSITTATKKNPLRLSMKSCDHDVLARAAAIAGVGTLTGPYWPSPANLGKKPYWTWSVHRSADAAGLLMTMFPLLGDRRQTRAREALIQWRAKPYRNPAFCRSGRHPRSGSGRCRECVRMYNAAAYKRKVAA